MILQNQLSNNKKNTNLTHQILSGKQNSNLINNFGFSAKTNELESKEKQSFDKIFLKINNQDINNKVEFPQKISLNNLINLASENKIEIFVNDHNTMYDVTPFFKSINTLKKVLNIEGSSNNEINLSQLRLINQGEKELPKSSLSLSGKDKKNINNQFIQLNIIDTNINEIENTIKTENPKFSEKNEEKQEINNGINLEVSINEHSFNIKKQVNANINSVNITQQNQDDSLNKNILNIRNNLNQKTIKTSEINDDMLSDSKRQENKQDSKYLKFSEIKENMGNGDFNKKPNSKLTSSDKSFLDKKYVVHNDETTTRSVDVLTFKSDISNNKQNKNRLMERKKINNQINENNNNQQVNVFQKNGKILLHTKNSNDNINQLPKNVVNQSNSISEMILPVKSNKQNTVEVVQNANPQTNNKMATNVKVDTLGQNTEVSSDKASVGSNQFINKLINESETLAEMILPGKSNKQNIVEVTRNANPQTNIKMTTNVKVDTLGQNVEVSSDKGSIGSNQFTNKQINESETLTEMILSGKSNKQNTVDVVQNANPQTNIKKAINAKVDTIVQNTEVISDKANSDINQVANQVFLGNNKVSLAQDMDNFLSFLKTGISSKTITQKVVSQKVTPVLVKPSIINKNDVTIFNINMPQEDNETISTLSKINSTKTNTSNASLLNTVSKLVSATKNDIQDSTRVETNSEVKVSIPKNGYINVNQKVESMTDETSEENLSNIKVKLNDANLFGSNNKNEVKSVIIKNNQVKSSNQLSEKTNSKSNSEKTFTVINERPSNNDFNKNVTDDRNIDVSPKMKQQVFAQKSNIMNDSIFERITKSKLDNNDAQIKDIKVKANSHSDDASIDQKFLNGLDKSNSVEIKSSNPEKELLNNSKIASQTEFHSNSEEDFFVKDKTEPVLKPNKSKKSNIESSKRADNILFAEEVEEFNSSLEENSTVKQEKITQNSMNNKNTLTKNQIFNNAYLVERHSYNDNTSRKNDLAHRLQNYNQEKENRIEGKSMYMNERKQDLTLDVQENRENSFLKSENLVKEHFIQEKPFTIKVQNEGGQFDYKEIVIDKENLSIKEELKSKNSNSENPNNNKNEDSKQSQVQASEQKQNSNQNQQNHSFNNFNQSLNNRTVETQPGFQSRSSSADFDVLYQQIMNKASELSKSPKYEIRTSFEVITESLGKLNTQIEKMGDSLTIRFKIESKEKESVLKENIQNLSSSLKQFGFEKIEIDIDLDSHSNDKQQYTQSNSTYKTESKSEDKMSKKQETDFSQKRQFGYNTFEYTA